ncbi:spondin domain-containing protein [Neiella marina]|uniref:Spondin domain-containing protein n=1 Tax=Neiella holothuriorum TaxID=2870530 RepID=A0ABS7EH33_9GAMM|nr:spondin domain-containing protein [Neiella holothuriorum]MBW8191534.1 spondin domain-containing protein [Neiella holothuriorum]
MSIYLPKHTLAVAVSAALTLGLTTCGGSSNNNSTAVVEEEMTYEYQVTVENWTAAQPFSPLTIVAHSAEQSLWAIGEAASDAIEQMAEGGDNSMLLDAVADLPHVTGAGIIMPGTEESVMVEVTDAMYMQLSATTMLVNTNDAFAGINSADISGLDVDESMSWYLPVYDAGTEYNTESADDIPGPVASGEGFSEMRDDVMNKISRHPGLVTQADDSMSVLMPYHRIDTIVGKVTITRMN